MHRLVERRPKPQNGLFFSLDFWARLLGMIGLGYFGWWFGKSISGTPMTPSELSGSQLLALSGSGIGLLLTHRLVLDPIRSINQRIRKTTFTNLTAIMVGGLFGVIFGALFTFPLSHLPSILGAYSPLIVTVLLIYFSVSAMISHHSQIWSIGQALRAPRQRAQERPVFGRACLLDTSAIIDGRIVAVARSGFLDSVLMVPQFVLNELQTLADSNDDQKRLRGRRGLDLLNEMQKDAAIAIEITTDDVSDARGVDLKLVALAIQQNRSLITNDKNLSQVAELQDVQVLNLNVLAEAVRPPVVAGDMMIINIREEGRERDQGIGYLEDGTMVVVEDAKFHINEDVRIVVNRVWATERGRMIFGRLTGRVGPGRDSH